MPDLLCCSTKSLNHFFKQEVTVVAAIINLFEDLWSHFAISMLGALQFLFLCVFPVLF